MDNAKINELRGLLLIAQENLNQVKETSSPRWWQPNNWRMDEAERIRAKAQAKYNAAILEAIGEQ